MKVLKYFLLALVLMAVALVSALTAMRLAIHGREVKVPNLIGMTPAQAERACYGAGFPMAVENRFYSNQVAEGRIMSQAPPAGATVRRGWRIRVAESLGPQRVSIPDLVGESGRAAEINLRRRGLELGTVALIHVPDLPPDQVVAQDPPPNASGVSSPRVNLLVTAPMHARALIMPEFVGRSSGDAIHAIQDAGLRLGTLNSVDQPGTPSGTVVRQYPAAGQKVEPGMTVVLEAAK